MRREASHPYRIKRCVAGIDSGEYIQLTSNHTSHTLTWLDIDNETLASCDTQRGHSWINRLSSSPVTDCSVLPLLFLIYLRLRLMVTFINSIEQLSNAVSDRHFRSYGRVPSPCGTWTFTECYLARQHHIIDVGITKCVFLLASSVTILSRVSNSSTRTPNKAFTACSLFITVIASFCAQRSKRPGTFVASKMPIVLSYIQNNWFERPVLRQNLTHVYLTRVVGCWVTRVSSSCLERYVHAHTTRNPHFTPV